MFISFQTVPGPVRNLHGTTRNSTNIDVYWSPPRITQGPILRYEMVVYRAFGQHRFYQFTDNFARFGAYTISGPLIPHRIYNFEVVAVSDYGRGPSVSTHARTYQDGLLKFFLLKSCPVAIKISTLCVLTQQT